MATPLNLKSMTVGSKARIFETTTLGTFVADIQSTESMNPTNHIDPANNQGNMFDLINNNLIHNIYPIDSVRVRSSHFRKKQSEQTGHVSDYVETYIPHVEYNNITQYNDHTFMLSDLTLESPQSPYLIDMDTSAKWPAIVYTYAIQSIPNHTYVYPSSGVITSEITSLSALLPVYNLMDIKYNYLAEIPMAQDYFFFNDGQVLGTAFNMKNEYDTFYNMNSIVISTDSNHVSASLGECRSYKKIGYTGDVLWASYKIDQQYFSNAQVEAITMPNEAPSPSANITNIPMSGTILSGYEDHRAFEMIETIKSINRFKPITGHKSNLYSINIQNAGINTIDDDLLSQSDKDDLKKSVNNIIKDMITAIMPLNTQLFNVYWTGE